MYAIIETGGKQVKVEPGKRYFIEKLDADQGSSFTFEQVLLVKTDGDLKIGEPYVSKASVQATVVEHFRDDKTKFSSTKRRKHHMKRQGHRQDLHV